MTTVLNKSIQRRWKQKADIFRVELAGTERVSRLEKQRRINVCELILVAYHMDATVWVNGTQVGSHPYGYTPFSFDITDLVKFDGENVIR